MYIVRMCGELESENIDKYLGGENCSLVVETNENGAQINPTFISDNELAKLPQEERFAIQDNKADSARAFRYLFHGDSLESVFDAMRVCANQPQNEATMNGRHPEPEDLWAGANKIKTVVVFEVPDETFRSWYNKGLLGITEENETYLNPDDDYCSYTTLAECGAGETLWHSLMDIAREQLQTGTIQSDGKKPSCLYFGEFSKAASYFDMEEDYLDIHNVFEGDFYLENEVGFKSLQKQTAADKNKTSCPYTDPELKEMYFSILLSKLSADKKKELFDTLELASTFDAGDRTLFVSSIREIINSSNSNSNSDDLSNDYENEF